MIKNKTTLSFLIISILFFRLSIHCNAMENEETTQDISTSKTTQVPNDKDISSLLDADIQNEEKITDVVTIYAGTSSDSSEISSETEESLEEIIKCVPGNLPNANSPDVDFQTWSLAIAYHKLCKKYNNNSPIKEVCKAYKKFNNSIFYSVDQGQNPNAFLEKARVIHNCIQESIDIIEDNKKEKEHAMLYKMFRENIMKRMGNRIDLARLDKNVFDKHGISGGFEHHAFSKNVIDRLTLLTGRVFQIDVEDNKIISTSSGLLIHSEGRDNMIKDLSATQDTDLELNSVLTCAHAIEVDNGRSEFYFVQSQNINLEDGFPNFVNPVESLVSSLRANMNSFRFENFTIKNRDVEDFTDKIDLIMGQPHYKSNEDVVIGHIKLKDDQKYIKYGGLCDVVFGNHALPDNTDYFAIGYPGCYHYGFFKEKDDFISPVFITKSTSTSDNPVTGKKGKISHKSPAARGMSGGPLFYIEKNTLNIFGVITSGDGDEEEGCYWK